MTRWLTLAGLCVTSPSSLESLPTKGIYTLLIHVSRKIQVQVQKLGLFTFPRGHYVYTGSAVGTGAVSLQKRVARHLRNGKIRHWHVDYLLANENAEVIGVVAAESSVNKECQINDAIKNVDGATVPIVGFGASDCKYDCGSHLVYFADENVTEKIVDKYRELFRASVTSIALEGPQTRCT